ncbi:MAG: ATP-binding protein [Calditrichia bacterium]
MAKIPKQLMQYFLVFAVVAAVSILMGAGYISEIWRENTVQRLQTSFTDQARLLQLMITPDILNGDYARVDSLVKEMGKTNAIRYTVVISSGQVIGDSRFNPKKLGNYMDRREVEQALRGNGGFGSRHSFDQETDIYYLAYPLKSGEKYVGMVRLAIPTAEVTLLYRTHFMKILGTALLVLVIILLIGAWAGWRINRPVKELEHAAEHFAAGDLSYRVTVSTREAESGLADALNKMAFQLNERIQLITRQRNELESVLANMVEGVIVLDYQEKTIRMNREAERIFGIRQEQAVHRDLLEIIRNADIHHFIQQVKQRTTSLTADIIHHHNDEDIFLALRGSVLKDFSGRSSEILLVFHDITSMKKLENMRRDFVANVSHELKTPITSIKGFVETLQDGAIDEPERAGQFLQIIHNHVDRLTDIINNLLTLSRIEQEMEHGQLPLEKQNIKPVLEAAIDVCREKAGEKNISISLDCQAPCMVDINRTLLEEAIVNLLDNAIKYSDAGQQVSVKVHSEKDEMVIAVRDEGRGIDEEHLPRVFERFYRVDKARTRKLGGTGLGLAIVKHIARAHNGRVDVTSMRGKGSTFYIYLPINKS